MSAPGARRALPSAGALAVLAVAVVAGVSMAGCSRGPPPLTPGLAGASTPDPGRRPPVGLDVVERLSYPPLDFDPVQPERFELSNGVTVFFLRDETLPLIDLFVNLKGGYVYFDREQYAAAASLLPLMRNGGAAELPPDSVDAVIEFNALGVNTSTDGGRMVLGVSALSRQLDLAVDLWADILLHPRFDRDAVDRWRVRELEAVNRIADFPGSLAVLEFNRLMYGEHPTGWIMTRADLTAGKLAEERLRRIHRETVCPERAVIGAVGDVERAALVAVLERALDGWEPCGTPLEDPPLPDLRQDRSVYVIPRPLPQSTVVVGQPGGVLLEESKDYFASRIANWVIGGSGFTSRLVNRLRTESGLAYTASSIWGAAREHERIFGAITHTKAESTVDAARMLIETLEEARIDPPSEEEVELARDAMVNGFVFGFNSPGQVVARQVSYQADGFPSDWLARYLRGIRSVSRRDVASVVRERIHPGAFTVLMVGDTAAFDASVLGPVTVLPVR
jgi:zinc protease